MMRPISNKVKNTLNHDASIAGKIKLPTAPMPAISAPMFMTMAGVLKRIMR